jgi:hypothetical protein
MFLLDKNKFIHHFLPPRRRKPIIKAWLAVIVWHVFELWQDALDLYNQIVLELSIFPTTDVLQAYLRSKYPNVGAFKVFIKNQHDKFATNYVNKAGEHHLQLYAYRATETPLYRPYIYQWQEHNIQYDYLVIVPIAYTANLQAIQFICNKYRPAGKTFLIQFSNITI